MRPPYTFTQLRTRARKRINDRRLPSEIGASLVGFDGVEPCALCDGKIGAGEVAYQIDLDSRAGKKMPAFFHIQCHKAWQAECAGRTGSAEAGQSGQISNAR